MVLPPEDYRDNTILISAANKALTLNITVPDGIEATARDGNLTLTGTVNYGSQRDAAELAVAGLTGVRNIATWAEHDAAVGAAWMASGVYEVHDDLDITG